MRKITLLFLLLFGLTIFAQQKTISGVVTDTAQEPIPGANVMVKETGEGATTDFDGKFMIKVKKLPATIVVSYMGYKPVELQVADEKKLNIILKENNEFLEDVVVTASRGAERIKESPVSIERMSLKEIKRTSAPSFYDALSNLKGVDLNTNSLTFQSVNTRGFATFSNVRFLQLIDGMDNTSPALNFPLGNLAGLNELDVQSVEILPGAASALYGANAFNGVLNMRSKNPFTYKGLSAYVKLGQTSQEAAGNNPYTDVGVRYAWGGDYVAAKINVSFMKGTDWFAVDDSDIDRDPFNADKKGSRVSNPSYDGMNFYGDEIATILNIKGLPIPGANTLDNIRVSRTGYAEKDLTDYEAKSFKTDFGFYYRPSGQPGKWEFSWNTRLSTGKTLYQGTNRYALDGIFIHQHKVELKNNNFYAKAYYTGEDAGNSYDTKFTAWNINRRWRDDRKWFEDYAVIYTLARIGGLPTAPGVIMDEAQAHAVARDFADNSPVDYTGQPKNTRFLPGTPEFEQAFNEVINDPDFKTGGKFIDNTNLKHAEVGYNFKDLIKFAEIQMGVSTRRYSLHSEGTIFTDYPGLDPIHIDEIGSYFQMSKKVMDDKLKLSASMRYDKQKNFDGNFSPRLSAVYSAGDQKQHNFRLSYQTGFRNPSTQELYIGIDMGPVTLLGAAPDNADRYQEEILGSSYPGGAVVTGHDAYDNAYTLQSFMAFAQAFQSGTPLPDAAQLLEIAHVDPIQPEQVSTIEFGYRGEPLKKLGVDFSLYYNKYNNFSANKAVMALAGNVGNVHDNTAVNAIGTSSFKPFYLFTNTDQEVNSYGMDVGFNYKFGDYQLGLIYDYAKFDFDQEKDPDFRAGFNMPEHRVKLSLGNDKIYKDLGFRIDYKYQTEFLWQASFADGIVPARSVMDAQVSYNVKKYNTKIKVGGSNLLGEEYLPAPGSGKVGSIYYISLIYRN